MRNKRRRAMKNKRDSSGEAVMLLVFFLILIFCDLSEANDNTNYLHLGMVSYHQDRDINYNERHKGFGIDYNGVIAGYYKNSNYKDSFYLMKNYRKWNLVKNVQLGYKAGIITGYSFGVDVGSVNVAPALIPTLYIDTKPVGIDVNIIPGQVYSVSFKIGF